MGQVAPVRPKERKECLGSALRLGDRGGEGPVTRNRVGGGGRVVGVSQREKEQEHNNFESFCQGNLDDLLFKKGNMKKLGSKMEMKD